MSDDPNLDKLSALEERIEAARAGQIRTPKSETKYEKLSVAWRMVLELVVGMAMGVGIGFGLDSLFGTLPIFLILFTLLGFAAGVRTMMRTAEEIQAKTVETPDRAED